MTEYEYYQNKSPKNRKKKCIDFSLSHGSECVGYCKFSGHEGFLTKELRKQHDCIGKDCRHYVCKSKSKDRKSLESRSSKCDLIFQAVSQFLMEFEGIKPIRSHTDGPDKYVVDYVTITNCYPVESFSQKISESLGCDVSLNKLEYDFDRSISILFGN